MFRQVCCDNLFPRVAVAKSSTLPGRRWGLLVFVRIGSQGRSWFFTRPQVRLLTAAVGRSCEVRKNFTEYFLLDTELLK